MDSGWAAIIACAVIIIAIFGCAMISEIPNRVTDEAAIARFASKAQVDVSEVHVIEESNNDLPWGDLHEVTYELEIRGKTATGTCTSGWLGTSPMVCKLYWDEAPQ